MNLGIVMLANTRSEHRQAEDMAREQKQFAEVIARYNGQLRRGDIAVEWQKIDATQRVLETSLLVRIYTESSTGREALPIVRVTVPGGRVCVDGLQLEFDALFS